MLAIRRAASRKLAYPMLKECISYILEGVRTMRAEWTLTFPGDVIAS